MGTGSLRIAVMVACLTGAVGAMRVLLAAEEKPAEDAIRPGDKVKVKAGPAPLMKGTEKLTEVENGTELSALKVQGKWVQVTIEKEDAVYTGWIEAPKHLDRFSTGKDPSAKSSPSKAETPPSRGKRNVPKELRWAVIVLDSGAVPTGAERAGKGLYELAGLLFKPTDDDVMFCSDHALGIDQNPVHIKRVLELVGEPDKLDRNVPSRDGKQTFDAYQYGRLTLRTDPVKGNIKEVAAPAGWWRSGIRGMAEKALKQAEK